MSEGPSDICCEWRGASPRAADAGACGVVHEVFDSTDICGGAVIVKESRMTGSSFSSCTWERTDKRSCTSPASMVRRASSHWFQPRAGRVVAPTVAPKRCDGGGLLKRARRPRITNAIWRGPAAAKCNFAENCVPKCNLGTSAPTNLWVMLRGRDREVDLDWQNANY